MHGAVLYTDTANVYFIQLSVVHGCIHMYVAVHVCTHAKTVTSGVFFFFYSFCSFSSIWRSDGGQICVGKQLREYHAART